MTVLVATDLSDHSKNALRWAAELAHTRGEDLTVAHVVDNLGDDEVWTALFETPDEIEQRVLQGASERVRAFTFEALEGMPHAPERRRVLVAIGTPTEELLRLAEAKDASLIVSATTGHGRIRNAVFGSTAHRLARTSPLPVVFVPEDASPPPLRRIMVAVDFSEPSLAALDLAAILAAQFEAKLLLVHALGIAALSPEYEPSANLMPTLGTLTGSRRAAVADLLEERDIEGDVVVSNFAPSEAIIEVARDREADLIVMGTHGRGAVEELFLGSVAQKVLRQAPCAVLTIRR